MGRSGGAPTEATITNPFEVDVLKYGTAAAAGTALTAALAAVDVTAHTRLAFPTASVLTWDSIPPLPRNVTGSLTITFNDSLVTLTSAGRRLFDFNKVADYDTFQNIEVGHVSIDANNLSNAGGNHVILGTLQDGAQQTRISLSKIWLHDITTVNVPVDATTARRNVFLVPVVAAADTLCNITDIRVERVTMNGGLGGVIVAASSGDATANCFLGGILIQDCWHSLLAVQSTGGPVLTANNFHVGSKAYGSSCTIRRCTGLYSGDTGVEINGMTDVAVSDCTMEDAYSNNYLHTNFRAPAQPSVARIVYDRCHARRVLQAPPAGYGWRIVANNSVTPTPMVLNQCSYYRGHADMSVTGEAILAGGAFPSLTLNDFLVDLENGSYSTPTTPLSANAISLQGSVGSTSRFTSRRMRMRFSGFRDPAAGTVAFTGVTVSAGGSSAIVDLDIDGIAYDLNLTNATVAAFRGLDLGASSVAVRGRIAGLKWLAVGDGTGGDGIIVRDTATLTISKRLDIERCDFSGLPSGAAEVLFTGANKDKVFFGPGITWRTFPALQSAISVTGSPFTYQNLDGYAERVTVGNDNGPVTKIEVSANNSTWTDTALTVGQFTIDNASAIRVTYTGSAPTMLKVPTK